MEQLNVRNPYTGELLETLPWATAGEIEGVVAQTSALAPSFARTPSHARAAALSQISSELHERRGEFAELICSESGKPLRWASAELARAVGVFQFAAEYARGRTETLQHLDTAPGSEGRVSIATRHPYGTVLGITPFNFPLNLVAHKVAPALAVGAPIVVKPSPRTPLSALALTEIVRRALANAQLSPDAIATLLVPNEQMDSLIHDERLPVVSFTGSDLVGWRLREIAPRKNVLLELGGDAAVIVADDYPDTRHAAERIGVFANYQAGQSCISVQRVYIHASRYEAVRESIVDAVGELRCGDPRDALTQVGPVIDEASAVRITEWIREAVEAGATILTGGGRDGTTVQPTVLEGVPSDVRLGSEEIFGPVVILAPYETLSDAVEMVNASRFGLQMGVFTRDILTARYCAEHAQVGGVIVGDVPSYRADQMPYGGVKASGVGREGVQFAAEDYTYLKTVVLAE